MSIKINLKKKGQRKEKEEKEGRLEEKEQEKGRLDEICDFDKINELYSKKCGLKNNEQLIIESKNRKELGKYPDENEYLYPTLDDPNFIIKIAQKKEFSDTKYDGDIYDVEEYANILNTAEYGILPQQAFVRNFLSFQTPYNSLLLFHGLGSGKTCSAIGVCEEMRDYLKQMGINKRIIIVASPNVQDNFKLQLFDERQLKEVDGIWTMKGCLGNKFLKEINPTGMKGLKRDKVIQQAKNLINASYSFQGYVQFSNEIVRKSGKETDSRETKIRNLEIEYSNSLVVIDEVHNIRISDDNENKNVAKNLMFLVSSVSNIRLLLLSATPMFNSYKEIVWLLNLLNMNDRRGIISVSDIFDKNGDWKKDSNGKEIGREMLIRKATGYISYVRGENPYTFPFRVYPDRFNPDHTFHGFKEYPIYQINGRRIADYKKIEKISLFLTNIGEYQSLGYTYIIDRLRNRQRGYKMTRTGTQRKTAAFSDLRSFGYTDLQIPIEALNIIYPYEGLEELVKQIPEMEYIEEEEEDINEIAPSSGQPEKTMIEEIDEVFSSGPTLLSGITSLKKSELESEPVITEGIEGDISLIDEDIEDIENIEQIMKPKKQKKRKTTENIIFNIDEGENVEVKDIKSSKTSFSNTISQNKEPSGLHIIEGDTKSNVLSPEEDIDSLSSLKTGGSDSSKSASSSSKSANASASSKSSNTSLYIDSKDLTGTQGLKRIMNFTDTKTPAIKGQFEYKRGAPHVFDTNEIGKYSSKIKNICDYIYNKDTGKVSEGIILIYSSYIDAGIIPVALVLEEMGFTRYGEKSSQLFKDRPVPAVDVRTMKPPVSKKDFKPARYVMITGDTRISPSNDADVKAITNNDNLFEKDENGNIIDVSGEIIKVVLISQAGSEGLDFKGIRQVHILEPWYNVNRQEQIIGRAVRNFSHKDLPFSKRNVQIFLYGTILDNVKEESADLYIYRISEIKAIKIGKVSRLLKQTAVDCIINHDQTQLIPENFNTIEKNKNITQILSDNQTLNNFVIGDMDNSATCDFMECEFKCLPNFNFEDSVENTDTYNETFMLINSDKIIQKIKMLMKIRYFYIKNDLFRLINTPKKYPISQIYASLTQIIDDNTEYLIDKYGRTGYLVNIGDYYLFQPSELNYKNISIYDRSVPIDYKHDMIQFQIKTDISRPVIDKRGIDKHDIDKHDIETEKEKENVYEGKKVLDTMFNNYKLTNATANVKRKNDNWYELCGVVIQKMEKEENIILGNTDKERLDILESCIIEHIVDSLMINEKVDLLNYIEANKYLETNIKDEKFKRFFGKINIYLQKKKLKSKELTGIVMFNGPSITENMNIFILDEDNKWIPAQPEDIKDLENAIRKKYVLNKKKKKEEKKLNHYVGFIGFETNNKYMVYQVKDTENERSTGFRCDQSGKGKIIKLLNNIESDDRFTSKVTKDGAKELCVRQELTLRIFEHQNKDNKTWFLDTETAIIKEFQKKEKR
jgi:hypothetical protein